MFDCLSPHGGWCGVRVCSGVEVEVALDSGGVVVVLFLSSADAGVPL